MSARHRLFERVTGGLLDGQFDYVAIAARIMILCEESGDLSGEVAKSGQLKLNKNDVIVTFEKDGSPETYKCDNDFKTARKI